MLLFGSGFAAAVGRWPPNHYPAARAFAEELNGLDSKGFGTGGSNLRLVGAGESAPRFAIVTATLAFCGRTDEAGDRLRQAVAEYQIDIQGEYVPAGVITNLLVAAVLVQDQQIARLLFD